MSIAVVLALVSLCFAGLLDVAYKLYARQARSRGMLIFGIGIVWLFMQYGYAAYYGDPPRWTQADLGFGLAAGVMVTLSNILLVESLGYLQISLGSTIYRLNTIGVVVLSVIFLDETLGSLKTLGIAAGILGVCLLYWGTTRRDIPGPTALMSTFLWVAILASFLRACYGVTTKAGLNAGADLDSLLLLSAVCWVIGGLLYAWLREKTIRITRHQVRYSLLTGMLVVIIVNTLVHAIELGEASTVVPIANLSFVAALLISILLKWERLSTDKIAAVALAAASIYLLAQVN